jgi:lysophospholipase L1-like esterase
MREVEYEVTLFQHKQAEPRYFTLNFPLYQGVNELHVGLDAGAAVDAPPPYATAGPIVFYGTSITQGGCACRPGMAHTNILSRMLNAQVINLGFSGNGKGEPEVARVVAEIAKPALLVLDFDANVSTLDLLKARLPEFIRILRDSHPATPILVISRPPFASDLHKESAMQDKLDRAEFHRRTVERRRAAGDANIHFCDGSTLMGEDFHECTVDGVHPTDLGFWRMAEALRPVIGKILS